MSVKSLTVVLDDDGREICVLMRTLDGHLTGHGVDLRNFLRGYIISRESKSADNRKTTSTIGRLAAKLIAEFNSGVGDFELLPCGTRRVGEEYIYFVLARHASPATPSLLNLRVEAVFQHYAEIEPENKSRTTVIYDGLLDEFDPHETQVQWSHGQDELDHFSEIQSPLAREATAN